MRVLIMTDMEGVSGIVVWDQVNAGRPMYEEGRRLYTEEINAAVRGARAGGATEIVVVDCHGAGGDYTFNSLIPEMLEPDCEWVAHHAWGRYTELLEKGCDACLLVGMHARGEGGALASIPFELEQNPEFHMGGGGLYGTAADYIKFTQMILNKGKGNGNQVLKPETVALMGQNHIGDLNVGKMISVAPMYTNDVDLYPDMVKKWGLSFLINTAKTPEGRSPGSLAWAGLANTYFWIDPARNVAGVILMQVLPFADQKCLEAFAGLERGVYAGLDAAQRAA
mgnify:CR=1 FL=1